MRKPLATLAIAMIAIHPAPGQTFPQEAQTQRCAGDWPDDFAMQKFCIDQQRAAFDAITIATQNLSEPLQATWPKCQADWPDDFTMQKFCLDQNTAAIPERASTLATLPTDVAASIDAKCGADWSPDRVMQAFCAKQQADGWKAINQ